jgi:hypothetical protein
MYTLNIVVSHALESSQQTTTSGNKPGLNTIARATRQIFLVLSEISLQRVVASIIFGKRDIVEVMLAKIMQEFNICIQGDEENVQMIILFTVFLNVAKGRQGRTIRFR